MDSVADLTRAVDRLVRRVAHWEAPRWATVAKGTPPDGRTRGDLMYALVQQLADRAADAEGTHRRPVPRLDNDGVLPDQLRVVAADLAAAAPSPVVLAESIAAITQTTHYL